jgi:beta-lactamase superfamily II metal-dependent hydrolase
MVAHYLDVGQADATLLEFPCGTVLIDAGEDKEHTGSLTNALNKFFADRPDRKRTIDVVFVTHTHLDHNNALRAVIKNYKVKHYIDNGRTTGSGKPNALWVRKSANFGGTLDEVTDDTIAEVDSDAGLSNRHIDPIRCRNCDPKISILSGSYTTRPEGWTQDDFDNPNNHSLAIRVEFGQATLLFTGDLEKEGLETLVDYYDRQVRKPDLLHADVYRVSHHGSHTGMTEVPDTILDAVSPSVAIISAGRWNFGKVEVGGTVKAKSFTTFSYGHPRLDVVQLWSDKLSGTRSKSVEVKVFTKSAAPTNHTVTKRVYATAWDGNINVAVTTDGSRTVTTNR